MSQGLPYSLAQLQQALGYVESSNRYDVLGPPTRNGGRAYGRYQVMDFNVPSWTEQYFGQRMTPEQFLANPEAQDAVFAGRMGEYYGNSTGDPASRVRNAASLWFTGQPYSADTANRSDGYINNQEYGDRVLRALGSAPQGADAMVMTPDPQPQQQGGLFSGIRNFFGGGQADPNAGSPTDPFANLSRAQRTMLGFAALRDAAASLEGRDSNFFANAMGGFEQARERERLRAQGQMQNRVAALQALGTINQQIAFNQSLGAAPDPAILQLREALMAEAGFGGAAPSGGMAAPAGGMTAPMGGGAPAPARPAGGVDLLQPGEAVDISGRPMEPYDGEPEVVPAGGPAPAAPAPAAPAVDPMAELDAQEAAIYAQMRERAAAQAPTRDLEIQLEQLQARRAALAEQAETQAEREVETETAATRAENVVMPEINSALDFLIQGFDDEGNPVFNPALTSRVGRTASGLLEGPEYQSFAGALQTLKVDTLIDTLQNVAAGALSDAEREAFSAAQGQLDPSNPIGTYRALQRMQRIAQEAMARAGRGSDAPSVPSVSWD